VRLASHEDARAISGLVTALGDPTNARDTNGSATA